MRLNYEMTQEDLDKILNSCKPVAMIALQCGTPRSPQENANAAWKELGSRMYFEPFSVQPTGKGNRFFSAETTIKVFRDGNAWCAVFPDFIDLQVSDAAFGDTAEEAAKKLFACAASKGKS